MGLSKKLGGSTAQKVAQPVSDTVPYKWSNQTYTVPEIIKKFKLPCVVQCVTEACTVVWSDFQFDLRQPLLLYSRRSVQKIHAVCLKKNNDTLEEVGPPLAIPQDYEGWFGAAPKGISKAKRHFRIEGVSNSTARRLLVTSKCPAFTSRNDADGNLHYVHRDIMPGDVLKRVSVMDSDIILPDCPDLVKEYGPCLECLDEKDEDVIIPLSHAALTYEVSETYPDDESKVFQITSPISAGNSKLPRILNLVHGNPPLLAYAFTGMMRCYSIFTEDTILSATLEDPESRCLELATDSCVKFRLGLNEVAVRKTCEYTNAIQMCENFGTKFITGIKVSFTLKPVIANVKDTDASFCESASDMQEVEANSEFDIAWGSVSVKNNKTFTSSGSLKTSNNCNAGVDIPEDEVLTDDTPKQQIDQIVTDMTDTNIDISDSFVSENRDFGEQEIVNLMLRKGLANETDEEKEEPLDMNLLKENSVTDNPLFYFFQRNSEQITWKAVEPESDKSSGESSSEEPEKERTNTEKQHSQENSLHHLLQKVPAHVSSKSDTNNPLSYLFERDSDQAFSDGSVGSNVMSNKKSPLASSNYPDLYNGLLDSIPDVNVSHYDQIKCKAAAVYTGNDVDEDEEDDEDDTDDDEEEDDDDDSESEDDEDDSECTESDDNCSEVSELSEDNQQIKYPKLTNIPLTDIKHSASIGEITARSDRRFLHKKSDSLRLTDISNTSLTHTSSSLYGRSRTIADKEDTRLRNVDETTTDSETDAVIELLTLAQQESSKYLLSEESSKYLLSEESSKYLLSEESSKYLLNEGSEIETTQRKNGRYTKGQQEKNNKDNAVHRINNLLEEVSELVSFSSDRILDSNIESFHYNKNININGSAKNQEMSLPISKYAKGARNELTSTATCETNNGESTLTNSSNAVFVDSKSGTTVLSQTQTVFDKHQLQNEDFTTKTNHMINIHPRLNKLQSEDTESALKRSQAKSDLNHIDQENVSDKFTTSNQQHRTTSSGSSISSIFSVVKNQRNGFNSPKLKNQTHDHSLPLSNEKEDLNGELTTSDKFSNKNAYQFPYNSQRVLSFTREMNSLAPFQNSERLRSTNDSMSSNCSSSLDNSFVHSVPNLVIIGDTDLRMENNQRLGNHSSEHFLTNQSGMPLSSNRVHSAERWDEVVMFEGYTSNGQHRSNGLSHEECLQFQNEGDSSHEDYV